MNMNQLLQLLGRSNRINTSDRGRRIEEQRIYERGTRTFYVWTEARRVRSIQTSASGAGDCRACLRDRSRHPQHGDHGLKHGTAWQPARDYQRQVRDMRACL